jgi:mannose-6-phosphate isomerase-like protein (cupin superfamily)
MDPIVLKPGGGEVITQKPERDVVIKAGLDALALTESRYEIGERGPELHVHREHTDAFYVLEGTLVFEFGRELRRAHAEAGAHVLVPANVAHTFWNEGPTRARFLNIHAPSGNFHHVLRARRDGRDEEASFDSFDPPPDGGLPAANVVVRGPGEGDSVSMGPSRALFKAEGADGDGTFSLSETTLAPGFPGPVPHRHETFTDSFYVLEGTLTVFVQGRAYEVTGGGLALAPPGTTHTFANRSRAPVRLLNLMAPGGFEQYLKEVAAATGSAPADPGVMAAIATRYDFHPVADAH